MSEPICDATESPEPATEPTRLTRRQALAALSTLGVTSSLFGDALTAMGEPEQGLTADAIRDCEWLSGIDLTDEKRELMLNGMKETLGFFEEMRGVALDNGVPPALDFGVEPAVAEKARPRRRWVPPASNRVTRPQSADDLAFLGIRELASLLRSRQLSSVELTELYLERLRRYDPVLRCVITLTPDLALEQARRADEELARGEDRGPLHGIPWGAKDIIAVGGYRTTWGARPYRDQVRPESATVAARLAEAGAVLVAKLSVGALAWGDVWFDATTKNPWNVEQGSSGSSAGPAAATAAGLAGFTLGSETWGSIVSPCTRCGASGLRPTFGRVSRQGVMTLAWSMDKIGPIARSVDDCALVFQAIQGPDGLDRTVADRSFVWPPPGDVFRLRVGYVPELFEEDRAAQVEDTDDPEIDVEAIRRDLREWAAVDRRTLEILTELGFELVPIELPSTYPVDALQVILTAEASAAFDILTRTGRDDELVRQIEHAWPNVFRQGQLIPAVEYLRANRIRTLVQREMAQTMAGIDVFVAPSFGGNHLLLTNLTGHPSVVLPNGFRTSDGTPTSITFTGKLFFETELLAVARTYQAATDFHRQRPPLPG